MTTLVRLMNRKPGDDEADPDVGDDGVTDEQRLALME